MAMDLILWIVPAFDISFALMSYWPAHFDITKFSGFSRPYLCNVMQTSTEIANKVEHSIILLTIIKDNCDINPTLIMAVTQ